MAEVPIENYVQALNQIDLAAIFPHSELQLRNIWQRLMGRQLHVKLDKLEFKSFHERLLEKAPLTKQKVYLNYFIQQFHAVENFGGKEYFQALNSIFDIAKAAEPPIDISLLIKEKVVPAFEFVRFLEEARDQYKHFKVVTDLGQLEDFYVELLPSEIHRCASFGYLREKRKFENLKAAVEDLITDDQVDDTTVGPLFDLYKALSGISTLNSFSPLQKKISDQKITGILAVIEKTSFPYYEIVAMRVARGSLFSGTGALSKTIMASIDDMLVDQVAERVLHYTTFDELLVDALAERSKLSLAVLRKLILNKNVHRLSLEEMLPNFNKVVRLVEIEPKNLFDFLDKWHTELPKVLEKESIEKLCPHMSIYEAAMESDSMLGKSLKGHAYRYIEDATEADYGATFMDGDSFLFQLLTVLLSRNGKTALPTTAFNAYKTALLSICNDAESHYLVDIKDSQWAALYQKSDKTHLQPVVKNIRDFFRRSDISPGQFLFFEEMFREIGALDEYPGECVRKVLMAVIDDQDCLRVLLKYHEHYTQLIFDAGNDAFDFIDTIRSNVEDQNGITEYNDLDILINQKLATKLIIEEAVINYQTDEGPGKIDATQSFRHLTVETGKLHFLVSSYSQYENISATEFSIFVTWRFNGILKTHEFDHSKWVRIL